MSRFVSGCLDFFQDVCIKRSCFPFSNWNRLAALVGWLTVFEHAILTNPSDVLYDCDVTIYVCIFLDVFTAWVTGWYIKPSGIHGPALYYSTTNVYKYRVTYYLHPSSFLLTTCKLYSRLKYVMTAFSFLGSSSYALGYVRAA